MSSTHCLIPYLMHHMQRAVRCPMQALRSLVAPDMLGHQLLLQKGVVPGLVNLIRPQHLTALASHSARAGNPGHSPRGRTVPGCVAAILQEAILHAQPAMLRDIYQVHLSHLCAHLIS